MQARWEVRYGPQFEESKQSCKMSRTRLQLHLVGLRLHLERDPLRYSEAFTDENHRVMDTADYFQDEGGVVLSAFVVLRPDELVAEIQWIEAGALPGEGDQLVE